MGWASGADLAERLWNTVREHLPEDEREEIAQEWIAIFKHEDCDTIEEVYDLISDAGPGYTSEWDEN